MSKSTNDTRRDFLKKSSLSTLGLTGMALWSKASNEPNATTKPTKGNQSGNLVTRKNIADIPMDDPEIKMLKDAVKILKDRSEVSPLDPMGWQAHGMLHATFCATSIYANQVHYNWYVWPWHRLYLWSMEQKLQKAVGEPKLALHYWDWTKKNTIPDHYWGDESNPLFNITRLVSKENEVPKDFINVGAGFRARNYKTFGGYPAIKKRGEAQLDGLAEQSFHNNIHNWIGGQMATFTESGFDPIFYAHHGNCDRIWDAWRNYHPDNKLPDDEEWLEKRLFSTDGNGRPVDFKIKELLDAEALGYQFEDLNLNPSYCNPYVEADLPKREAGKNDCIEPLNITTSQTDKIYKEFLNKERTHVILHFERAQLPYQPYCARVFFEYEVEETIVSKYTGTFTILPILDLDTVLLQQGVHLQIEIEKEIADAIQEGKDVNVVFQPVPLPNRDIPDEILKLENISLKLEA